MLAVASAPALTPSCVSCRGSRPWSARWSTASWSLRAVWLPSRTYPDRKDPPQTEPDLLAAARGRRLRTLCRGRT